MSERDIRKVWEETLRKNVLEDKLESALTLRNKKGEKVQKVRMEWEIIPPDATDEEIDDPKTETQTVHGGIKATITYKHPKMKPSTSKDVTWAVDVSRP